MEDRKFKGLVIPEGDTIMLSPSLAGRREEVLVDDKPLTMNPKP
jgi:cytochrome P450